MAIKDPLLLISVDEFKTWKGFNTQLLDKVISPDSEIWYAITIASSNIDYLSGFNISKNWPESKETDFTNEIKLATAFYVRFLLGKSPDYMRGQASIAQGGVVYSQDNPNDPYFIVPEVFNALRKIENYITFKGFNINKIVNPLQENLFMGTGGEYNKWELYLEINNLISGYGLIKKITHPKNIIGSLVTLEIDKNIIPNLDDYYKKEETDNLLSKKADKDLAFNTILDKEITTDIADIIDPNPKYKWILYKYLDSHNPNFDTYMNGTLVPKLYVDSKLLLKQDKLIAGNNIKIENNIISATGGLDPNDYYKKNETYSQIEVNTFLFNLKDLLEKEINQKQDKLINGDYTIVNGNKIDIPFNCNFFKCDEKDAVEIKHDSNDDLTNYLLKNNNYLELTTNNKTIIGAIKELNTKKGNWKLLSKNNLANKPLVWELERNKKYYIVYTIYNTSTYKDYSADLITYFNTNNMFITNKNNNDLFMYFTDNAITISYNNKNITATKSIISANYNLWLKELYELQE